MKMVNFCINLFKVVMISVISVNLGFLNIEITVYYQINKKSTNKPLAKMFKKNLKR